MYQEVCMPKNYANKITPNMVDAYMFVDSKYNSMIYTPTLKS